MVACGFALPLLACAGMSPLWFTLHTSVLFFFFYAAWLLPNTIFVAHTVCVKKIYIQHILATNLYALASWVMIVINNITAAKIRRHSSLLYKFFPLFLMWVLWLEMSRNNVFLGISRRGRRTRRTFISLASHGQLRSVGGQLRSRNVSSG